MKKMKSLLTIALLTMLCAFESSLFAELCGPDYAPPFEVKQSKRIAPELVVKTFIDENNKSQPMDMVSLVMGNKRISVREIQNDKFTSKSDNSFAILINSKTVFQVIFAGGYTSSDNKSIAFAQGYKRENSKLSCDFENNIIKWSNRYILPDGTYTDFVYQLKPVGDGKVELSWDHGCTQKQFDDTKSAGCLIYFSMPAAYRKAGIEINGSLLKLESKSSLQQDEQKGVVVWRDTLNKMVYNPTNPLDGFSISILNPLRSVCTEKFAYNRFSLGFKMSSERPTGKMIIDFGDSSVASADAPPAVEGVDLWKQDALHMPLLPTRNLFPNPSFEQGMRYWRWWSGGAKYTPSEVKRYGIDSTNGLFGSSSMVINPTQHGSLALKSFSLPSKKGRTYTVSYYAKAENSKATIKLALLSSKEGGQFNRGTVNSTKNNKLTKEWQRFSQSFVSDGAPIALLVLASNRGGKVWLDGIQYEAGDEATEFVYAPLEGLLTSSNPDNNIEYGSKLDTEFEVKGKKGTVGKIEFTLMNFYKNILWDKSYRVKAGESVKLPFDSLHLPTGTYILRACYKVVGTNYYDFYRFTIIKSLNGTHATKDLYGNLFMTRDCRTEDRLDLMERLGYGGSTSYGPGNVREPFLYELREKYNVTGYTHSVIGSGGLHMTSEQRRDRHPDVKFAMSIDSRLWRTPKEREEIKVHEYYSPEVLQRMEELAEKNAREHPYVRVWSIATEEEGTMPPLRNRRDFKEYAKLQEAFYKGIKKGNPEAIALPSGGTSGYGKVRGREEIEGYLEATQGKVKWDAVAIHPYGSIDGTLGASDLDESIQMLSDSMAKYGYGEETPILLNEGGGGSASVWGDGPSYSYSGGQPSYDQGLHEFLHAAKFARQYIICLKYWPRLPHFNTWQAQSRTIVDYNLTPTPSMLGINTLGQLLGNPEFVADIRPAQGMRGYAFKDDNGKGVAAVWCTLDDVELGFKRGPVMRVKFDGKLPEIIDLMGDKYPITADKDGYVDIQLTPAPLFLIAENPNKLAKVLNDAEIVGAGANVKTSFIPTKDGKILAELDNLTGNRLVGDILIDGEKTPFDLAPMKTSTVELTESVKPEFGHMFSWNNNYALSVNGKQEADEIWNMDYFYAQYVNGEPDWDQVASIKMTNLYRPVVKLKQTPGGHKGDIEASFKVAWNENNLYLRVEAEDDIFNVSNDKFWNSAEAQKTQLYALDGCLEVYFDCGVNGRLNNGGFDLDDYRYDFCVANSEGKSGAGFVNRLREVFTEYGGGVEFPTKEEAAKGIQCEFTRVSETKYIYTITFAQKYLEPFRLKDGSTTGFAMYLHDRQDDGTMANKGLSLATEPGSHCDNKPQLWPVMILKK
jgi:hypothetical protein